MKVIYFNLPNKPSNCGQSQKVNDVAVWVSEHSDLLPNATITSDRLTFDVTDGTGYAIIFDCPNDFEN